jgi:hypothetical protein
MRSCTYAMVSVLVVLLAAGATAQADSVEERLEQVAWQPLFDGKSLDGWTVRSGFAKYHIEDGAIVGTTVEGSPNTFLCTQKQYGDFILEFEVKVDPPLNSGVQIRSHAYEQETVTTVWRDGKEREQKRPAGRVYGYQVEIASGTHSGSIYDEARLAKWLYDCSDDPKASEAFKDGRWNTFRVLCYGDLIKTWVNGVPCTDMRDPVDQVGFIGLQVHGYRGEKPAQVRWRNLRIKDLGRHVWKPLFDGASLAGWEAVPGGQWQIRDGILTGTNTAADPRHGLLLTDATFDDFTVQVVFKAVKGNSGLYFRAEKVPGSVGVHGFQAEIDANNDVGGLYETGGRAWVIQPGAEEVKTWFKPQQWNRMTVSAHEGRIVVHVNGRKSAELMNDPGRLQGHLALQLHGSQEVEVQFKDIRLLVPKDK